MLLISEWPYHLFTLCESFNYLYYTAGHICTFDLNRYLKCLHIPSSHKRNGTWTEMFYKQFRDKPGLLRVTKLPSTLFLYIPFFPFSIPSPPLSACRWENSPTVFRRALTLGSRSFCLVSWHCTPPSTRWKKGENRMTNESREKQRTRAIKH